MQNHRSNKQEKSPRTTRVDKIGSITKTFLSVAGFRVSFRANATSIGAFAVRNGAILVVGTEVAEQRGDHANRRRGWSIRCRHSWKAELTDKSTSLHWVWRKKAFLVRSSFRTTSIRLPTSSWFRINRQADLGMHVSKRTHTDIYT